MKGRCILKDLKSSLLASSFSHIYIEKDAKNHPNTKKILSHFKNSTIIAIDHYKDVFNRRHQSFVLQKESPKLILAVKKDHFIYKGAEVCEDFGHEHFYYTSSIMNCVYNCEYCYLQGMYPSGNIVVFVNIEDIFKEVEKLLLKHPVYLTISYETDLLALENITTFTSMWMKFAMNHPSLTIELRTKSSNFKSIQHIEPLKNVILAWTLSPDKVIELYEKGTPSLRARLTNINSALKRGWNVRLCFDPILYIEDWKKEYDKCIQQTFKIIPSNKIYDVSIGVFRISKDYIKRIQKERPFSLLLAYPFECNNGVCTYLQEHVRDIVHFVYKKVAEYVDNDKIYV